MKTVMQCFKDELLPYFGIKEKAVAIAPTEAVHLELKKLLQDFNLVMEDGSWSHFEFQSKNESLEGLKRFRAYEAVTSYQSQVNITTYVLFSGTNTQSNDGIYRGAEHIPNSTDHHDKV